MNAAVSEPSLAQLATKVTELTVGMKWFLGMFLAVVSIPNVFASLAIHRFQEIFQDALPGKPLPDLTLMFVSHPGFFQLLTLAWPLAGLIFLARGTRVRTWVIGGVLLILAVGLQFMLTEYAMFAPMVGIDVGMSDGTAK